jgi:hypothetical protein
VENKPEIRKKRDLTTLYDSLFDSLDRLRECKAIELEAAIKRAAAVRQTAHVLIETAKLDFAYRKLTKTSSLDSLFPDLGERKQLGAGEKRGVGSRE